MLKSIVVTYRTLWQQGMLHSMLKTNLPSAIIIGLLSDAPEHPRAGYNQRSDDAGADAQASVGS
jgi:hypothetical protein